MPSFFGFREILNKEYLQRAKKYKKTKDEFVDDIKNTKIKNKERQSAVGNDVDKIEFSKRYRNGQITCLICIVGFTFSIWMTFSATTFLSFMVPLFASVYVASIYFKFSYELWRARIVASKWSQRNKVLTTSHAKYLKAVSKKITNIIPTKLEYK